MNGLAPWAHLGLEWSIKGGFILLTVLAAVTASRKSTTAWKAFLLSLGLCCLLALPLAAPVRPYLIYRIPVPVTSDPLPSPSAGWTGPSTGPADAVTADQTMAEEAAASRGESAWHLIFLVIWGTGFAFVAGLFCFCLHAASGLRKRAQNVADPDLRRIAFDAGKALRFRQHVAIMISAEIHSPAAGGILRPCLILPIEALTWPAKGQRAVLLHEFAHLKRRDVLCQLAARLATALFWFNPLVWNVFRRLRAEQEMACDDLVLA